MSIAQQVHEWLQLIEPGEEVTTTMMREIVPEGTAGAVSSALAAFSLCDPPLLELVARRRIRNGGVAYVYKRTHVPIKNGTFKEGYIMSHGSSPGHKPHVMRGADLPIDSDFDDPPSAMKGAGS